MALDKLTQITTSGINSTTPLSGINVTGIITASSLSVSGITTGAAATFDSVDVLGVLTYDDVTNVDALGIVTARSGVRVTGGVTVGTGATLDGSTNVITASTNGSERLRITSGGNIGINTDVSNNPSGSKLVVGGRIQSNAGGYWFAGANGAEDGWHVQQSSDDLVIVESGVAERVRITSNGNVGIGTQIPAGKFQVGSNGSSNVIITENIGVDINDGAFNLYQATSNVNAAPFILSSDVGGTEVEKVRITAAGKVGIGTDNPDNPFHVLTSSTDVAMFESTSAGAGPAITLDHTGASPADDDNIGKIVFNGKNDANESLTYADIKAITTDVSDSSEGCALTFNTRGAGSFAERLRVSADGFVTKPNHPCFDAVRSSGHLSSATYITYNNVKANNGNHYDSSNGRFTAPVAGYYFFSWTSIKNNDSATVARLHIHTNGIESYGGRHLRLDGGQAYGDNGTMTAVIQLAKDDYVQIYLTAGSVYGVTEEYCIFNGYLLG